MKPLPTKLLIIFVVLAMLVSEVDGAIIVAGSSTVFPLTERMAERFRDEGYAGNITIDSIGSGAGYRALLQGRRDRHRQRLPPHP
jgi:ABC-type phosphate transport system substrate-binding protein